MIMLSTVLENALLGSGSLHDLLASGKIHVFSGPVPASADDAVDGSSVALVAVDNGGTGVTFDATPTNGVLKKTASETWTGPIDASGNAAFYRLCVGSDDGTGAAGAGNYRVQGTIGTDASFDLVTGNVALTSGGTFPIADYQLYF